MRKHVFLLFLSGVMIFSGGGRSVFAQESPTIAVYVTGSFVNEDAKALGTLMLTSLINRGRYIGIERPADFIAEIDDELHLQDGAADESVVYRTGKKFGARYVCIVDVAPVLDAFKISARIIDVETAVTNFAGESVSAIKTLNDLTAVSDWVVHDMLQRPIVPPRTEVQPQVEAPPEPAVYEPPVQSSAPVVEPAAWETGYLEGADAAEAEPAKSKKQKVAKAEIDWEKRKSVGVGGFFVGDFGGGIKWRSGDQITMPYSGGGGYIYWDIVYAEFFVGFSGGGGKWASDNVSDPDILPNMSRSYLNLGIFVKYPVSAGIVEYFPIFGLDWELSTSGKIEFTNVDDYEFDGGDDDWRGKHPGAGALSALWFKLGGGADILLSGMIYLRVEALYGWRTSNGFETDIINGNLGYNFGDNFDGALPGHGINLKIGVGIKY